MQAQRVVLTERLTRAAAVLRHHQEFVPCRRDIECAGVVVRCELMGPGRTPGTARLRGWWEFSREGHDVPLEEVALPGSVAQRLEAVASAQLQVRA